MTQQQFADRAGIGLASVSNLMRGAPVGAETLEKVGEALRCEPHDLLVTIARTGVVPGSVGADQEPSAYVAKAGDTGGGLSDELLDMLARSYRQGYEAGRADRTGPVGGPGPD